MQTRQLTRAVDRDLVNVGTRQSVELRISVAVVSWAQTPFHLLIDSQERSPVQKRVGRQLDSGNQRSWGESSLFDISVVVLDVSVELDLSDFLHGELAYS